MRRDEVSYAGVVGRQVVEAPQVPHDHTEEARERARSLWPERDLSDFELTGTPLRPRFVDRETGEQFVHEESAILLDYGSNQDAPVEFFLVDAAGRVHPLRRWGAKPPEKTVWISSLAFGRRVA